MIESSLSLALSLSFSLSLSLSRTLSHTQKHTHTCDGEPWEIGESSLSLHSLSLSHAHIQKRWRALPRSPSACVCLPIYIKPHARNKAVGVPGGCAVALGEFDADESSVRRVGYSRDLEVLST